MWSIVMLVLGTMWFLSEVLIGFLTRSKKPESKAYDRNSLKYLWIVIVVSISAGVFIATRFGGTGPVEFFSGMALILTGMIIRFVAIFSLKSMFNSNVSIHKDHRLKTDGIYKRVRHPSYTGSLLSFFGLGLALGNWISFLLVFLPVLGAFLYRIRVEEKALYDNFRDEYLEYRNRSKKLIPYLY